MNWNSLHTTEQLTELIKESVEKKILIFKHSTRCSISQTTLNRLERNWDEEFPNTKSYFLDLLSYREVSNAIAERFDVEHQSPQVLIISKGKSIYDRSHFDIDYAQLKTVLKN
jgi:bacillithiol system protein YtxJ